MSTSFIFLALSLGFLGSFHCIGMCGPIALALPVHHFAPLKKQTGILLYQSGRLLTYSVLGLLFGILGQGFFSAGLQQWLSISIGLLLLLGVAAGVLNLRLLKFTGYSHLAARATSRLSQLFRKRGLRFLFLTGVLNGLLPCGLVYIGIAGAAASGSYLGGALFMLLFGAGTLPAMYAVALLGQFVSGRLRNQVRRAMPVMMTAMALLLILRGLNLGIPYLSPELEQHDTRLSCCPEKSDHPDKTIIHCSPKINKK